MLGSLQRGRRRRAGGLAAAQPRRHDRRREPRRLADHGRRPGSASDMLRSRGTRREEPLEVHVPDPIVARAATIPSRRRCSPTPSGWRCMVVLETLTPAERLAFVLHDLFAVPFDEIAPIVGQVARRRPASWPAGPGAGCRACRRRPTPTSAGSARSSTPSSPPPAAATSTPSSPCSTPTSCCGPTPARTRPAACSSRGAATVAGRALMFARVAPFVRPALVNGAAGVVVGHRRRAGVGDGLHRPRRRDRRGSTSSPTPSDWRPTTSPRSDGSRWQSVPPTAASSGSLRHGSQVLLRNLS